MSNKLDMTSPDLVNKNIERLTALFPYIGMMFDMPGKL